MSRHRRYNSALIFSKNLVNFIQNFAINILSTPFVEIQPHSPNWFRLLVLKHISFGGVEHSGHAEVEVHY